PELERRAASSAPPRLGWPAPPDPGIAIDDTERDLAVLERLLADTNAKGHARYLLDANPILARSLRSRWQRWDKKWREADGLVRGERLASSGLRKRAYSASALQQFAICPYRFFLYSIHQLRPREEAAALEQMDPLTRGALFHRVQLEWFRALRAQPQASERLLDLADEVLNRVATEFEQKLAPAIPRVWRDEIEALRSDLRGWVRHTSGDAWQPLHAEFAFGLPHSSERDPSSHPDAVAVLDGVRLRGSIDLIEKHPQGGALRITDHKTGKAPERVPAYTGGGEFLQPILYSLATEKLFGATVESGRLFYCTQRGSYTEVTVPLDRLARNFVTVIANAVDQSLEAGFLPPAPKRGACELCDYRVVCGPYEEMRFKLKLADDRLDTLGEVRNQP
ncbi:MAG: RecB family exonuclease, partial [Longimicrobiales bacterium]